MRLSWYADTGVAVFSIWQGGTCTGTFRVPIADLPRLVDALQRGPGGATAPGADVPGTGARQIPGTGTGPGPTMTGGPPSHASGPVPGGPGGDPLAGSAPAGYSGAAAHADAGQYAGQYDSLAGYGAPDRQPERPDPGAHGGYPDPAGRGGYADPPQPGGLGGAPPGPPPGGYDGYPDPAGPLGQAGSGGYPDPGQAAYGGYPDPGEHRRPVAAAGPGHHGSYPDAAAYGGYPDPDDYRSQAEPVSPARGYPQTASYGGFPDPGDNSGQASAQGRGYPETGEYSSPRYADPPGPASYPAAAPYGGYPDPGLPPAGVPPTPPQDHTSLMPAQPDVPARGAHALEPGTPTAGMPAVTGGPGGSPRRGSNGPPYPPDPYLDGELPVSGDRSAAGWPADDRSTGQRPVPQRPAKSGSRRSEDDSARELPYGYPPAVGR
jgi:hypothetical protein